jgi:hypothetical protein
MKGDAFAPVPNRGLITISIMLANIMQGVDNTILNVALPHIQGSLSASLDQIAWALTSYGAFPPKRAAHQTMPCARDRKFADSPLEERGFEPSVPFQSRLHLSLFGASRLEWDSCASDRSEPIWVPIPSASIIGPILGLYLGSCPRTPELRPAARYGRQRDRVL